MILAIHSKSVSDSLARRSPGKLGYARWLTTANRVLRVLISSVNPSENLCLITNFIIEVYARTWFDIKSNSNFTQAPIHIFNMIRRISSFGDDRVTVIAHKVLQTNAYALHSENMLCAMLASTQANVRTLAVERILNFRRTSTSNEVRKFIKPKINFSAQTYYELIEGEHWNVVRVINNCEGPSTIQYKQ